MPRAKEAIRLEPASWSQGSRSTSALFWMMDWKRFTKVRASAKGGAPFAIAADGEGLGPRQVFALQRHQAGNGEGRWRRLKLIARNAFRTSAARRSFSADAFRTIKAQCPQASPELGAVATACLPLRVQERQAWVERVLARAEHIRALTSYDQSNQLAATPVRRTISLIETPLAARSATMEFVSSRWR